MRKCALVVTAFLSLSLSGCGEGHGLLGPDTVGDMVKDDGVQYAALWNPCGAIGDRSEAELLADGKTWVVNQKAGVSDTSSNRYQVKVKVNGGGKLEVLAFTHGAKAGEDASVKPESEHRVALMKVTDPPTESVLDKKPKRCTRPSPSPSSTSRRPSGTSTPTGTPSASVPKPTPTKATKSATTGSGTSGGKRCTWKNGVQKCS